MTFPFAQPSPGGIAIVPSVYIGKSQGAFTAGAYTWAAAPVALGANDWLVVLEHRESNAVSTTTGVTIAGTAMTHWGGGSPQLAFINACYVDVWYAKPGAMATGNIVASSAAGTGENLFAYRLGPATNATPKASVGVGQANSNTCALASLTNTNGGTIVAGSATQFGATTFTTAWSGSEVPVIDFQGASATGNNQLCAAHLDSIANAPSGTFTFNYSATRQRIAGGFSMGP